jgi:chromosome segregation ATPase
MAGSSDERVSCKQPVGNIDVARHWQSVVIMKQSDTKRILEMLTQLTEAVGGPPPGPPAGVPKASLSDRLDKLDARVSEVQLGLATLAADTKAQFQKVDERFTRVDERFTKIDERFTKIDERFTKIDERFDSVDVQFAGVRGAIESTRVQLMDLVGRVHNELTGRIVDLEGPGTKGSGGGVPLAS